MLLHCAACLVYGARELHTQQLDLAELVRDLVEYAARLGELYSKQAVDWCVCAVVQKRPALLECITRLVPLSRLEELVAGGDVRRWVCCCLSIYFECEFFQC